MKYLATIILLMKVLLLALPAHGENVQIAARIGQKCNGVSCSTEFGYGSGVTIGTLRDGRQAILTAAHVVRGADRTWVYWYDSAKVEAQVLAVATNDGMDVALLAAHLTGVKECMPLMNKPPSADAEVVVSGFPSGSQCVRVRGSLFGRSLRVRAHDIRQGMSGGGVKCGNELAGIVSGYESHSPGNGVYTASWLIAPWITQRIGYLPTCPQKAAPAPPIDDEPTPLQPMPDPISTKPDASLLKRLDAIERALSGLRIEPGPKGERGPQGPMGPAGPAGKPGTAVSVAELESELDRLNYELEAMRNERIRVQIRSNGKVIDDDTYPRTGPIILDFAPVTKAASR